MRTAYNFNSPFHAYLLEQDGRNFTLDGTEHTLSVRVHRTIFPIRDTVISATAWERNADCGWDLLESENLERVVSRWPGGRDALEAEYAGR